MPAGVQERKVGLRFQDWPETDHAAWAALFAAGDVFEETGGGRHWAPQTRITNRHHYARWLGWLAATAALDPAVQPWARVTPEQVRCYAEHLLAAVAPRTAASALIGLKVVVMAMHREGNWRWLMDLTNRLNTWAEPSVDRTAQTLPIEQIHNAALRELDRLQQTPLVRRIDRVAYRDTLIVLLLSAAPVRMRNPCDDRHWHAPRDHGRRRHSEICRERDQEPAATDPFPAPAPLALPAAGHLYQLRFPGVGSQARA